MSATPDPTTAYARAAAAGKVVVGRLVKLACERHLADLKDGPVRSIRWDAKAADRAFRFIGLLSLGEGAFEGRPFILQPFQQFIVGSLFGWKGADSFRRFRTAYVEIGKGNGKTPLAAAVGLYGLVADGEAGAEVYSAATTREQAGILFRDAQNMAKASKTLAKRLDVGRHNIANPTTNSFFRPVSSEHRGLDGKRPHVVLVDEVHEHPNAMVVDKMRAGTKGRRQALILEITNSGYDRESVCWHHHAYSIKVLEGQADDSWFAFVCQLDACDDCRAAGLNQPKDGCAACDDWKDEAVWPKANPGLGVIIPHKYVREQVREAVGMPSKEGIVKRLNFCVWTELNTSAIPMDQWDMAGDPEPMEWRRRAIERLRRRPCKAGLDIGSTSDLTALALLFHEGDDYTVLPYFWIPERSARKRSRADGVSYEQWVRQGWVLPTEGDTTDYDRVKADVLGLTEQFAVREIAVDRLFQGVQLSTQLMGEGLNVIAFGQGFFSMAAPVKRMLELIQSGKMLHGGNPVLRWMASNAATEQDPAGNLKWSKKSSGDKIDGIVAATMALGREDAKPEWPSVYETRGILSAVGGGEAPQSARGGAAPETAPASPLWAWGDDDDDD